MCVRYLIAALVCVFALTACSGGDDDGGGGGKPSAEVFTSRKVLDQSFYSRKLGREVKYNVLLPESYLSATGQSSYPVAFMLHGYGDGRGAWFGSLNIQSIADEQLRKGACREMIYIMPDGYNSYYCNAFDGSLNYMDMFCEELVPLVDKRFRTKADAASRSVIGYSMGGWGALTLAMQHPGLFGTCVALSPSMNTDSQYAALSQGGFDIQWASVFGGKGTAGSSRLNSYYKSQCPLHIVAGNGSALGSVRFFVDCGDDEERLYEGSGELHCLMSEHGLRHEYRMRNGAHTTSYWASAMPEALRYVEYGLADRAYPTENQRTFATATSIRTEIAVGDCKVVLRAPQSPDGGRKYTVVYAPLPDGGPLSEDDIAAAMDSLMAHRSVALAMFPVDQLPEMESIVSAVERQLPVSGDPAARLALVTGGGCDRIMDYVNAASPLFAALYVENCAVGTQKPVVAGDYYLDAVDGSALARRMNELFCKLRQDGASVECRVRNGVDSRLSVQNGVYELSRMMNKYIRN